MVLLKKRKESTLKEGRYKVLVPEYDESKWHLPHEERNKPEVGNGMKYVNFLKSTSDSYKQKGTMTVIPKYSEVRCDTHRPHTVPLIKSCIKSIKEREVEDTKNNDVFMKKVQRELCQEKVCKNDLMKAKDEINEKLDGLHNKSKELKNVSKLHQMQISTLRQALSDQESIKQNNSILLAKTTQERMHRNGNLFVQGKKRENKSNDVINDLEYRYNNIACSIAIKRLEVQKLLSAFEQKMKKKEAEELDLRKEMSLVVSELRFNKRRTALQPHFDKKVREDMECDDKKADLLREEELKKKMQYEIFYKQTTQRILREEHTKQCKFEVEKRKASVSLGDESNEVKVLADRENRRLLDVTVKEHKNALLLKRNEMRRVMLQRERQRIMNKEKITSAASRREILQEMMTNDHAKSNQAAFDSWMKHYQYASQMEMKTAIEHHIQHFKKAVRLNDAAERRLMEQLQAFEDEQKHLMSSFQDTKLNMAVMRKRNDELIQKTYMACQHEETLLGQILQRKRIELYKVFSEREERIQNVMKRRERRKEDDFSLQKEIKEQERLLRIEEKTMLLT